MQEAFRIVLSIVYEPIFQDCDCNHGFRPKKTQHTAIKKLINESQGTKYALKGNIKKLDGCLNYKVLLKVLEKKIEDVSFLKLAKNFLKHDIFFKKEKMNNLIELPKKNLINYIFFNIYAYEFDLIVLNIKKEFQKKNDYKRKTFHGKLTPKMGKMINQLYRFRDNVENIKKTDKKKFIEIRNWIKKIRKKQLKTTIIKKRIRILKMSYVRYASDWVLITNIQKSEVKKIKIQLMGWLNKSSKAKLRVTIKFLIVNIKKRKAFFLAFSIRSKKQQIIWKRVKRTGNQVKTRKKSIVIVGIDQKRVKWTFINAQIMNKRHHSRSVGFYCSLKPWYILQKFRQKLKFFLYYYYEIIWSRSELYFYYYIYKFSCLKTLAHNKKLSITQITKKSGKKLKIEYIVKILKRNNNSISKKKIIYFPPYLEIMNIVSLRILKEKIQE